MVVEVKAGDIVVRVIRSCFFEQLLHSRVVLRLGASAVYRVPRFDYLGSPVWLSIRIAFLPLLFGSKVDELTALRKTVCHHGVVEYIGWGEATSKRRLLLTNSVAGATELGMLRRVICLGPDERKRREHVNFVKGHASYILSPGYDAVDPGLVDIQEWMFAAMRCSTLGLRT